MLITFEVNRLVTQGALDVRIQMTTSPFSGVYVNTEVLFPGITVLFTFHWNEGAGPPFVELAVKVTGVPAITGLAEATIEMLAVRG